MIAAISWPWRSKIRRRRVDVVVARRDDRVGDRARDAATPGERDRRVGVAQLGHVVRPDADQRVVVDAVVLALELHDLLAAGVGAGDAHRVHRRLGARHGQARHVDPAGQLADELDRPDLVLARQAEADAAAHPLVDVVVDPRVAVPEDDRPIAHPQVDVLVAVVVPDQPALAAIDVDRVLAPRPEVRVRATGHVLERSLVHRRAGGSRSSVGVVWAAGSVAMGSSCAGLGRPGPWDAGCAEWDGRPPSCHSARARVNATFVATGAMGRANPVRSMRRRLPRDASRMAPCAHDPDARPSRSATGCANPARRRTRRSTAGRAPATSTSRSSAAGSPACGPRSR